MYLFQAISTIVGLHYLVVGTGSQTDKERIVEQTFESVRRNGDVIFGLDQLGSEKFRKASNEGVVDIFKKLIAGQLEKQLSSMVGKLKSHVDTIKEFLDKDKNGRRNADSMERIYTAFEKMGFDDVRKCGDHRILGVYYALIRSKSTRIDKGNGVYEWELDLGSDDNKEIIENMKGLLGLSRSVKDPSETGGKEITGVFKDEDISEVIEYMTVDALLCHDSYVEVIDSRRGETFLKGLEGFNITYGSDFFGSLEDSFQAVFNLDDSSDDGVDDEGKSICRLVYDRYLEYLRTPETVQPAA
jgi:hypothetical protein